LPDMVVVLGCDVVVVASPDLEASLGTLRHESNGPPRPQYLEGDSIAGDSVDELSLELRGEIPEGGEYIEGDIEEEGFEEGSRSPSVPESGYMGYTSGSQTQIEIPVAQKFEDANLAPGFMLVMAHAVPIDANGGAMAVVTPHSPHSPVSGVLPTCVLCRPHPLVVAGGYCAAFPNAS
jgi:hypothetical protein